jgi:hypothetical protein
MESQQEVVSRLSAAMLANGRKDFVGHSSHEVHWRYTNRTPLGSTRWFLKGELDSLQVR